MRRATLTALAAAICLFTVAAAAPAQALRRPLRTLAAEITREFLEGQEQLLFRVKLGVAEFSAESERASSNSVAPLVTALLTEELGESTVFTVIERRDMAALLEEIEFNLSDLAAPGAAAQVGQLEGVDVLLLGSVNGAGEDYLVTARLVEVAGGRVLAGGSVRLPSREIEEASRDYAFSSFQSRYGISVRPAAEAGFSLPDGSIFAMGGADLFYRATRILTLGIGFVNLGSAELESIDVRNQSVATAEPATYDVSRYFRFKADGLRLSLGAALPVTPRLSLGAEAAVVAYFRAVLEQDVTDFPVWELDDTGSPVTVTKRIIVNGQRHDPYFSYYLRLQADYLVSRRLSLFLKAGGFLMPPFTPQHFTSAGKVQDNSDDGYSEAQIDMNGTFSEYQNFNFARTSTGERVSFQAAGVSVQVGVGLHF
jgi:TolB-like protein